MKPAPLEGVLQAAMSGHLPKAKLYVATGSDLALDTPCCLVPDTAALWLSRDPAEPHMVAAAHDLHDIGLDTSILDRILANARRQNHTIDAAMILRDLNHYLENDVLPEP